MAIGIRWITRDSTSFIHHVGDMVIMLKLAHIFQFLCWWKLGFKRKHIYHSALLNCKGLSTLCISYNSFIAYQKNAIAKEVEHISTNGPLLKKETM
jgi:hypothetical protein